jgi:hypothetical protein
MSDPYSGGSGSTKQEIAIFKQAADLKKARVFSSENSQEEKSKDSEDKKGKKKKEPIRVSELYNKGIALLKAKGYVLDLVEGAPHINHRILKPAAPPDVKGIKYPHTFKPLQDISDMEDFEDIEKVFYPGLCEDEVRTFWEPLHRPKPGDSDLASFTARLLKMQKISQTKNFYQEFDFGHTFDPMARLGGTVVTNPRIWVPDRDWFDPVLYQVKLSDVFTIFPEAELEILKLIIGRIGVGRSKHRPPGKDDVVEHTARMAGVVVGKDPGLGKSECFNSMTAAFSKCGFSIWTFKSTEERFGVKSFAMSDISYKDDTSLSSLKKFLSAEETKIMITNGLTSSPIGQ